MKATLAERLPWQVAVLCLLAGCSSRPAPVESPPAEAGAEPARPASPGGDTGAPDGRPASDQPIEGGDATLADEGLTGAFVVRREGEEAFRVVGGAMADERFSPVSTFKIPNSLIGLETGVLADASSTQPWDGVDRSRPAWNRDHDLASALAESVVWYYQEVARRVGLERMTSWVARLGYGNGLVGDRVDEFWLGGPLAISPREQVLFLERLTRGELPVSARSVEILREIMPSRAAGASTLRAKTGTFLGESSSHAWLVGWVERDGRTTACFALLLTGAPGDVDHLTSRRWDVAARLLEEADAL